MSLTKIRLWDVVKKQFFFKLKANRDAFSNLIWIQLLGIIFGLSSSHFYSSQGVEVEVNYYSADAVIILSMIWIFSTAITITTKPYGSYDFTFVTNRLSSSLSNLLFLLTGSVVAAVMGMLSRFLIQIIQMSFGSGELYTILFGIDDFFIGAGAAALYLFFISALGYLIGTLVQVSKVFIILIPIAFIGGLFMDARMNREPFFVPIAEFYFMESSFLLFFIKVFVTVTFFFGAAMAILNRMEVRK